MHNGRAYGGSEVLRNEIAQRPDGFKGDDLHKGVELRLRGRGPEFVVTAPATDSPDRAASELLTGSITLEADQGAMDHINLRLPARLKTRIEAAATAADLSVNAWLVRVAALAAEGARLDTRDVRVSHDGRRYRGWVR